MPDVCPSNVEPTRVFGSAGKVLTEVSSFMNSYFWFMLTPPGLTTAPSLNILSPNLCI